MRIEDYSFGRIVVDGTTYTKDIKIIKGEVVPKWWRESGHLLQYQDIEDIVAAEPDLLIVGTGSPGRLKIDPELPSLLEQKGIKMEILPTQQAIERFNTLVEKQGTDRIAAALHLTC